MTIIPPTKVIGEPHEQPAIRSLERWPLQKRLNVAAGLIAVALAMFAGYWAAKLVAPAVAEWETSFIDGQSKRPPAPELPS